MKAGMKFITLLAVIAAGSARAGVYVEMVDHQIGADKTTLVQKLYVQGSSGRFVDVPEEGDSNATAGTGQPQDCKQKPHAMHVGRD